MYDIMSRWPCICCWLDSLWFGETYFRFLGVCLAPARNFRHDASTYHCSFFKSLSSWRCWGGTLGWLVMQAFNMVCSSRAVCLKVIPILSTMVNFHPTRCYIVCKWFQLLTRRSIFQDSPPHIADIDIESGTTCLLKIVPVDWCTSSSFYCELKPLEY